jgi:hypothetical protein
MTPFYEIETDLDIDYPEQEMPERTPENDISMAYCQNCPAICEVFHEYVEPSNPKDGQQWGELTWVGDGWDYWGCRRCMLEARAAAAIDIETGCELSDIGLGLEVRIEKGRVIYSPRVPVLKPARVKVAVVAEYSEKEVA